MSATPREKRRRRVAALPGVRFVRRPEGAGAPPFDLAYVRTGPVSPTPVVVIPGGPGLASVLPYGSFRRRAEDAGMDVIMVEHRGVGLSRTDLDGADLPGAALTIREVVDDIAAVLDAEGVERATIYGSSYGSYLAQGFGVRHPGRVAAMVLDSPVTSAHDHLSVRGHARGLLWEGDTPATATSARLLRSLVASGAHDADEASTVSRIVYEFAGPATLERLLTARSRGRASRTWRWLADLGGRETTDVSPFVMEFDLVARIAFRELDYAPAPDGGPFDPAPEFSALATRYESFDREPFDLPRHWAGFDWPLAVLSGDRDLRTPRPVAAKVVRGTPDSAVLRVPATGHSALDTHLEASLAAITAVQDGTHEALSHDPGALAALRRRGASRHVGTILRARLALASRVPPLRPASIRATRSGR